MKIIYYFAFLKVKFRLEFISIYYLFICRDVQKDWTQPIQKSVELYSITWMEAWRSPYPQTCPHEVWSWEMEKDSKIQMSCWQINRADLHADSKIVGPTVFRWFYGLTLKFVKSVSRQYEKDRCDKEEQFYNKYKQQPNKRRKEETDLRKSCKIWLK